ncbi:hypothetical protein D1007_57759 [Hordeum vulgare]|nr:hypothetical protein D1007_57759 [Hordeum vulgare]
MASLFAKRSISRIFLLLLLTSVLLRLLGVNIHLFGSTSAPCQLDGHPLPCCGLLCELSQSHIPCSLYGQHQNPRSSNTNGEQELGQLAHTWIMHGKPRTRRYLKPGSRAHCRRTWGA